MLEVCFQHKENANKTGISIIMGCNDSRILAHEIALQLVKKDSQVQTHETNNVPKAVFCLGESATLKQCMCQTHGHAYI